MELDKIFSSDDSADRVFNSIDRSVSDIKAMQKRKVAENVQIVVQALKKIESDLQDRFDGVTTVLEKRVNSLKDGRDGLDGRNGRDGKDGRPGRDGAPGPRGFTGAPGMDGRDGEDGVSVVSAKIDFDGSLIIGLSSGREINVGEVVAPDLAERIKVITNGGGTSQSVLNTLASLQVQIDAIVAMGSTNYRGTWNATTNTPTITSSVGTKGDYYVVSVAGSTTINGISTWVIGDWIIFNGSVWQRIDNSTAGTFTNLSASGTVAFTGLTANQAVFTNGSDELVSNAITGTGNVVMSASPTLTGTTSLANLTTSGTVTHNGGTANGVAYLNGSKVLTSGTALTFDGTNFATTGNATLGGGAKATDTQLNFSADTGTQRIYIDRGGRSLVFSDATSGIENYRIAGITGVQSWGVGGSEQMRLTSTGLGIGTSSPAAKLEVRDTNAAIIVSNSATRYGYMQWENSGSELRIGTDGAFGIRFDTASNRRMTIDATGNLGLGVTPSAWSTTGNLQLKSGSNISAGTGIGVYSNSYFNSGWKYVDTSYATGYGQSGGAHLWFIAPSGTAGNAISFTQAMTLDASGNLGIGATSPGAKLEVAGAASTVKVTADNGTQAAFQLTQAGVGNWLKYFRVSDSALIEQYGGTDLLALTTSGNLGLGVSPSAWGTGYKAFDLNTIGSISSTTSNLRVVANAFFNGTNWVRKTEAEATRYDQNLGQHKWLTAAYGVANSTATFTQAMTLDENGNLLVGTTTNTEGARIKALRTGNGTAAYFTNSSTAAEIYLGGTVAYIGDASAFNAVGWDTTNNRLTFLTGGSERIRVTSAGEVYIAGTTDQGAYNLQVNGTGVWGAGAYVNGSDARLKENVQTLGDGLAVVNQLRPVTFQYKSSYSKDTFVQPGFIAQELQEVLADKDYVDGVVQAGPEHLNVAYQTLIPVLTKAIQEQQALIAALTARVAALESN